MPTRPTTRVGVPPRLRMRRNFVFIRKNHSQREKQSEVKQTVRRQPALRVSASRVTSIKLVKCPR